MNEPKEVVLIVAPNCPLCRVFAALLRSRQIPFQILESKSGNMRDVRAVCKQAVYGLVPLLRVTGRNGERIIEDWRAVYRFIDEHLSNNRLAELSPRQVAGLFEYFEETVCAMSGKRHVESISPAEQEAIEHIGADKDPAAAVLINEWRACIGR